MPHVHEHLWSRVLIETALARVGDDADDLVRNTSRGWTEVHKFTERGPVAEVLPRHGVVDHDDAGLAGVIAWAKPEEIASIEVQFHYFGWQEISDPPKWDPRNRETADHSMPYNIARHLIDKQIYLDSFTKEKYMDPVARELMNKITIRPLPDRSVGDGTILTVRKKSGEERVFKGQAVAPMSHDELIQKHNRISDFMQVSKEQRDRARAQWMNLRTSKDIGEPMQTIAKFGRPKPLADRSPARIS